MKRTISLLWLLAVLSMAQASPTDVRIQRQCLHSLARFMQYARTLYTDVGVSARGDSIGYFRATEAGRSTEDGVRTNADLAMVAAYVYERGRTEDVDLPAGLTYPQLRRMAIRSFRYACATHRANRLAPCTDGKQWGSAPGHHQWESSLWALSVAVAAHFIDDGWGLNSHERQQLERLLASEADYELSRPVPTGHQGDTKAEENGWEANVLAAACAFMPRHEHASQWREAMLRYGFNCYTVAADARDDTPVAGRKASDWFAGANLFDDFTLQNHGYFHISYQNVVMQEQAESIVMQQLGDDTTGEQMAATREALTWHWAEVWQQVLAPMALCDGEMAMPNGNDWSMFLFDQLPAYAAMATIGRNADALLLEERCLQSLTDRQRTTSDGAYMLHPDIGARRMGVTAHRVLMTALLHELFPTDGMRPVSWADFQLRHAQTRVFPAQQVVRSMSADRFACFSWSEGLQNCAALIVPNTVEASKVFVPYKKGFGGNIVGQPAKMAARPTLLTDEDSWVAYATGPEPYCIWATAGNAVLAITGRDAQMAVSVDPMTSEQRTIHWAAGRSFTSDARKTMAFTSQRANVDGLVAMVLPEAARFSFGGRETVNSIQTAQLRARHSSCVYFSNVDAEQTARLAAATRQWKQDEWTALLTCDPDGTHYLLAFCNGTPKKHFKVPRKVRKLSRLQVKTIAQP